MWPYLTLLIERQLLPQEEVLGYQGALGAHRCVCQSEQVAEQL